MTVSKQSRQPWLENNDASRRRQMKIGPPGHLVTEAARCSARRHDDRGINHGRPWKPTAEERRQTAMVAGGGSISRKGLLRWRKRPSASVIFEIVDGHDRRPELV
ncbi:hypothetical protein GWI33_009951 [Rhynchophorus ferrugineus]|uniref:Uncharacterized protein n=1 Tax=Rhynchophorus ferrugineus TaxID=354439 RepID=A0A834MKK2_RHYFE|nr:hypothetical protein GWI33_009951 [Rhynchophorus ferrugineus]